MREPRRKGAADASSSTPIYKERRIGTRYYGGETPEPKTKKKKVPATGGNGIGDG